jgi:hypothetical protein
MGALLERLQGPMPMDLLTGHAAHAHALDESECELLTRIIDAERWDELFEWGRVLTKRWASIRSMVANPNNERNRIEDTRIFPGEVDTTTPTAKKKRARKEKTILAGAPLRERKPRAKKPKADEAVRITPDLDRYKISKDVLTVGGQASVDIRDATACYTAKRLIKFI